MNFAALVDAARAEIASPTPPAPRPLPSIAEVHQEIGPDLRRRHDLVPLPEDVLLQLGRFALAAHKGWALVIVDYVLVFLRDDRPGLLPHTTGEQALLAVVGGLVDDPDLMAELPPGTLPLLAAMVRHARAKAPPLPSTLALLGE